jgi:quinol monooxygenase YgiN
MLTITAIIRAKKGHEDMMRRALLEVADNVRINEPNTIGFFVSQDQADPSVFTTHERFLDQTAMDAHNNSPVVARFFGIAKPILDGDVVLVTATEISAKGELKRPREPSTVTPVTSSRQWMEQPAADSASTR